MELRSVAGTPRLVLMHNFDDDSRHVVNRDTGEKLLQFTCSLVVKRDGKQIGSMSAHGHAGNWVFRPDDQGSQVFDTGIHNHDYHWTPLELAEVKVARHILGVQE